LLQTMRAGDGQLRAMAETAFASATMSADDVAASALRAVERGELYCLRMREGRIVWRLKRLLPYRFARLVARLRARRMAAFAGVVQPVRPSPES
jgi:hypothetical protein